jgi:hypothetical protein
MPLLHVLDSIRHWENDFPGKVQLFYILFGASSLGVYLLLIRWLRYRRRSYHNALFAQYSHGQDMSVPVAQQIYTSLFDAEFPFFLMKGIQLGLFRTYSIPTISSLLNRTALLSSHDTVARRYAETEVLFLEFAMREWGSVPWLEAMARTRAIHAAYRKAGSVREEDMLYTLAALMTQGVNLIEQWEWRNLSDVELCAAGTLYRGIADAMGIDYSAFLSDKQIQTPSGLSGLDFFHALRAWQRSYEARAMFYTPQNHVLAQAGMDLLLCGVPGTPLKKLATAALTVLMDVPLRTAVGYPAPPRMVTACVTAILFARRFFLRHFCPPRPEMFRIRRTIDISMPPTCAFAATAAASKSATTVPDQLESAPHDEKKTVMTSYIGAPYFVAPSVWNRWSPGAWWWWMLGLPLPGDKPRNGSTYHPGGYSIPQVGPRVGKGVVSQRREEDAVREVVMMKGW